MGLGRFWNICQSLRPLVGRAPQGFLPAITPGPGPSLHPDEARVSVHVSLGQSPPLFHLEAYQLVAWPVLMALKALPSTAQLCRVTRVSAPLTRM